MPVKSLLVVLFCLGLAVLTSAQKLPSKQETSLRAPTNIKIDGKATEWGNQFQAYNQATQIFYTLANDDDNLYLALQIKDVDALTKVTLMGIKLIINTSGNKNEKSPISVTYPYFEGNHRPYIGLKRILQIKPGSVIPLEEADSVRKAWNKKLDDNSKYIKVSGMLGLDSLISVYNDAGLHASQAFDNNMAYTYELAVPLKLLNININNPVKFAYHLVLEGAHSESYGQYMVYKPDGKPLYLVTAPGASAAMLPRDHLEATNSTTDFWGEYTLAKKP